MCLEHQALVGALVLVDGGGQDVGLDAILFSEPDP